MEKRRDETIPRISLCQGLQVRKRFHPGKTNGHCGKFEEDSALVAEKAAISFTFYFRLRFLAKSFAFNLGELETA